MGQQQLLLVILGVIILGIAIAIALSIFYPQNPQNLQDSGNEAVKIQTFTGENGAKETITTLNQSAVTTSGNHSYVSMELDGKVSEHVADILRTLKLFEEANPSWEITSWHVEKYPNDANTTEHIYGLWIDHREKKK
jgi:hypothetical protein